MRKLVSPPTGFDALWDATEVPEPQQPRPKPAAQPAAKPDPFDALWDATPAPAAPAAAAPPRPASLGKRATNYGHLNELARSFTLHGTDWAVPAVAALRESVTKDRPFREVFAREKHERDAARAIYEKDWKKGSKVAGLTGDVLLAALTLGGSTELQAGAKATQAGLRAAKAAEGASRFSKASSKASAAMKALWPLMKASGKIGAKFGFGTGINEATAKYGAGDVGGLGALGTVAANTAGGYAGGMVAPPLFGLAGAILKPAARAVRLPQVARWAGEQAVEHTPTFAGWARVPAMLAASGKEGEAARQLAPSLMADEAAGHTMADEPIANFTSIPLDRAGPTVQGIYRDIASRPGEAAARLRQIITERGKQMRPEVTSALERGVGMTGPSAERMTLQIADEQAALDAATAGHRLTHKAAVAENKAANQKAVAETKRADRVARQSVRERNAAAVRAVADANRAARAAAKANAEAPVEIPNPLAQWEHQIGRPAPSGFDLLQAAHDVRSSNAVQNFGAARAVETAPVTGPAIDQLTESPLGKVAFAWADRQLASREAAAEARRLRLGGEPAPPKAPVAPVAPPTSPAAVPKPSATSQQPGVTAGQRGAAASGLQVPEGMLPPKTPPGFDDESFHMVLRRKQSLGEEIPWRPAPSPAAAATAPAAAPEYTPEKLHLAKRFLAKKARMGDTEAHTALMQMDELRTQLRKDNPMWAHADDIFAGDSQAIEFLNLGRNLMRTKLDPAGDKALTTSVDAIERRVAGASASNQAGFRDAAQGAVADYFRKGGSRVGMLKQLDDPTSEMSRRLVLATGDQEAPAQFRELIKAPAKLAEPPTILPAPTPEPLPAPSPRPAPIPLPPGAAKPTYTPSQYARRQGFDVLRARMAPAADKAATSLPAVDRRVAAMAPAEQRAHQQGAAAAELGNWRSTGRTIKSPGRVFDATNEERVRQLQHAFPDPAELEHFLKTVGAHDKATALEGYLFGGSATQPRQAVAAYRDALAGSDLGEALLKTHSLQGTALTMLRGLYGGQRQARQQAVDDILSRWGTSDGGFQNAVQAYRTQLAMERARMRLGAAAVAGYVDR